MGLIGNEKGLPKAIPPKPAVKRSAEDTSGAPAEKRQKTGHQLSEPVSIKLESVVGHLTGLIFKGKKVKNPESSILLGKHSDFYLELDHSLLFENVRLRVARTRRRQKLLDNSHIRDWLQPIKINDSKFHYQLGLHRFPDRMPADQEGQTRTLEENEIFVVFHEFNYMVKRKWYFSHHEPYSKPKMPILRIGDIVTFDPAPDFAQWEGIPSRRDVTQMFMKDLGRKQPEAISHQQMIDLGVEEISDILLEDDENHPPEINSTRTSGVQNTVPSKNKASLKLVPKKQLASKTQVSKSNVPPQTLRVANRRAPRKQMATIRHMNTQMTEAEMRREFEKLSWIAKFVSPLKSQLCFTNEKREEVKNWLDNQTDPTEEAAKNQIEADDENEWDITDAI